MTDAVRRKIAEWPWYALLWIGAAGSIVGMARAMPTAWDLLIYQDAMRSLREGLDPYVVGQARQIAEHARGQIAFTYVYPPVTLVILRLLNYIPALPGRLLFWTVYGAGFGCQLWAGFRLARPAERKLMQYLLPLAVFFPGLIPNEVILSGNIAVPLYGAAWVGAIRGWKTERWGLFYAAVLAASLFKAPLLTLLAIPVLMGAAQIVNSALAAAGGLGLFFVQRLIWPAAFGEYLSDVQMQFTLNHDFGHSLAAMVGHWLFTMGRPFTTASTAFYLAYGAVIFVVLAYFVRAYRRIQVDGCGLMALLLTGTVLLNPRIMTYDALAITVPMMLLVVRGVRNRAGRWCLAAGVAATVGLYVAGQDNAGDAILVVAVFAAGALQLRQESRSLELAAKSAAMA